jgi:STAS-like domain of unknown function (DUF4325)
MKIVVVDLCEPFCVDPADGVRTQAATTAALQRGEAVCLDFSGVTVLTSSFLNTAVGRLYAALPAGTLESRLTFTGLDAIDEALVREVQANARRFYAATPEQQAQLVESASHLIENS